MRTTAVAISIAFVLIAVASPDARAQVSDGVVKIGVLNDQSGPFADLAGPGSVIAAKMAVEDFGGKVKGKPIEIVVGDHQNKPDIGLNIARRWYDVDKVDMVIDVLNSAVALAVQQVALQKNKILIGTSIGATDFSGKACNNNSLVWTLDSFALSNSVARGLVGEGLKSWYVISVDYSFGHALLADTSKGVKESGGQLVGNVKHPLGTADFSSFLLQAQSSKAQVVAFANAGADFVTASKQAAEFGLNRSGKRLVGLVVYITDVHSLGLQAAQGLTFSGAFYWDRTEEARTWSKRFYSRFNRMPTQAQASVYSAIMHYLKAIDAADTDETDPVLAKMKATPVNDFFAENARIRADGTLMHDMYLMQVKEPAESKGSWDYYKVLKTIPGDVAFRSVAESECPLLRNQSN